MIDLTELIETAAKQSGKSELEILTIIVESLAIKAEVYGIPQRIEFRLKENK